MNDVLTYIQQLVEKGKTEDALKYLLKKSKEFQPFLVNDLVMLSGQYANVKTEFLLNVLTREEFEKFNVRVNYAILEIALRFNDFTINTPLKQSGKILYRIPSKMLVNSEIKCVIRIAYNETEILKDIIVDNETKIDNIRIAEIMNVELIDTNEDKVFNIRTFTDEEQFIISEEYTQWIFLVKPVVQGTFPLILKVAVIESINGKERKRNIVFEKQISIVNQFADDSDITFEKLSDISFESSPKKDTQTKLNTSHQLANEQKRKCQDIIYGTNTVIGAFIGSPLPRSDVFVVLPSEISMVIELGQVFDITLTTSEAIEIIKNNSNALTNKQFAQLVSSWIPIIGNLFSYSLAERMRIDALGWAVVDYFKNIQLQKAAMEQLR